MISEISVTSLKKRMDAGEELTLIDVREQLEWNQSRINHAKLIPLGTLASRAAELDKSKEIIIHCKLGGRSMQACQLLASMGFTDLKNVTGGITAWIAEVDPSAQLQ